ncbi:MAG TPA: histidine phosphatase family protein [Anaerolineaceae bacterium]|jgi:probable phosphoglycerate mutase|nr:histidine phosphatase family protein [Anaerolineaceae bacterium]
MKLYFVRHGESEANVLRVFSNRPGKHGLTETGRQQAAALAAQLHGIIFERIFASPLLRAQQTAEILNQNTGAVIETTAALQEYDLGNLEDTSYTVGGTSWRQTMDAWLLRQEWDLRTGTGENFHEIRARFEPFVQSLISLYGARPVNILCVGHGGLYRCMLPIVLGNISFEAARDLPIHYASVIIGEYTTQGLTCIQWGDQVLP